MNMPSQKSLKVSTLALACAMSATLILGGCGGKDKSKNAKIAKLEKVDTRKVDNAEAAQALTALSLNESGSGALSWAKRTGDGGNYTYTDVVVKGDKDADVKIAKLELFGAHMQDEQANFDKIEFRDFTVADKKEDRNFSIGRVSLVNPSPDLAASIIEAFSGAEDGLEDIDGDISFQAMSFSNMKASGDGSNMSIKSMSMGEAKDMTGVFSLTGLDVDAKMENDDGDAEDIRKMDMGNLKISLGSFNVTGANMEKYKGFMTESMKQGRANGSTAIANIMKTMNVYDPDFKSVNLRDLDVNADGMVLALKSYEASMQEKDGVVTMSHKMSPLSIIPAKDGSVMGQKRAANTLSKMGYDRFEFSMGGNSIMDENADTLKTHDSFIELRDGFRLSYDLDISGYKDFTEQAVSAKSTGSLKNPMAAMGMASALEITKLRIALRDDSIVDRYFKMTAEQRDTTADALKQKIKDSLGRISMEAEDEAQQKFADELLDSVTSFLDGGGTLVFEMAPANPVNPGGIAMGAMFGAKPDFTSLGITISTQ